MPFPFGAAKWPTVRELIGLFVAMGCELRDMQHDLTGPDGTKRIRFLYNPETEGFASLNGYEDDERIPPSEIEQMERRLGVVIPRNPKWH